MPILNVAFVLRPGQSPPPDLARTIADAAAGALGSPSESLWVRLDVVPAGDYAENGGTPGEIAPVFVSILKREPPRGEELTGEVAALTRAIAHACGRSESEVHLIYEPAARGRVAFGGRLVE